MKDKVFIAWSGSNTVAMKVKHIMEKDRKYVCSIGGNADNNSQFSSVGDTVIQQIKICNQAIVIFQNRKDGNVSNNLFFELGYVLAKYGQMKVHCVKRSSEVVTLPSDFDNSFVESLEEESDDDFAQKIVDYFMSRQKLSVNTNKMYLINNRYLMHDYISAHYSESGSKCSDYELAQYILFYAEAANLFNDTKKVHSELLKFKNTYEFDFSEELSISVNLALTYLGMVNESTTSKDGYYQISKSTFVRARESFERLIKNIVPDDSGIFDEWAFVISSELLAYTYMLFGNNTEIDDKMRRTLYTRSIEMTHKTLEAMDILCNVAPIKESNDDIGLLCLIKSYVYGNEYLSKKYLGTGDELEPLKMSLDCCSQLKELYGSGTVDSQLYNTIHMRYYLLLSEYLAYSKDSLDDFDRMMYMTDIDEYIEKMAKEDITRNFIDRIKICRDLIEKE